MPFSETNFPEHDLKNDQDVSLRWMQKTSSLGYSSGIKEKHV